MQKALITGVGGPAGRAVTTYFLERGWSVSGTDSAAVNSPVQSFDLVPRGDDPLFMNAILELLDREKPSLLVPTVSEELPSIARSREEIRCLGTDVFISNPEVVDILNDKYLTARTLGGLGIPVPRTLLPSDVISLEEAGIHLGYPFLAKPRVGRGGRGVEVYCTPEEASHEQRKDIVFQEFLPGEEYDVNVFAFPAGHTKSIGVLRKTKMKQGYIGNALSVSRVIARDAAEIAISAVHLLGAEGPIDIDMRRDAYGTPHIIEINARVGANILSVSEVLTELSLSSTRRHSHDTAHVVVR